MCPVAYFLRRPPKQCNQKGVDPSLEWDGCLVCEFWEDHVIFQQFFDQLVARFHFDGILRSPPGYDRKRCGVLPDGSALATRRQSNQNLGQGAMYEMIILVMPQLDNSCYAATWC